MPALDGRAEKIKKRAKPAGAFLGVVTLPSIKGVCASPRGVRDNPLSTLSEWLLAIRRIYHWLLHLN